MHAKARKSKEKKLGKNQDFRKYFEKEEGLKNANFPENRVPQERILKTGEDKGLFGKKLGSERCFEKKVCFERDFETKRGQSAILKKSRV